MGIVFKVSDSFRGRILGNVSCSNLQMNEFFNILYGKPFDEF